jgi:hypothetical protein
MLRAIRKKSILASQSKLAMLGWVFHNILAELQLEGAIGGYYFP